MMLLDAVDSKMWAVRESNPGQGLQPHTRTLVSTVMDTVPSGWIMMVVLGFVVFTS